MGLIRVGNAPCSWGVLEFEGLGGEQVGYGHMLDELVETGYTGTELRDWGYMRTDTTILRAELARRDMVMLGAFVTVAPRDRSAHASGVEAALQVVRLLAAVATEPKPYLVLADNSGSDPIRTQNAGRIMPQMGLDSETWPIVAQVTGTIDDPAGQRKGHLLEARSLQHSVHCRK